MVWQPVHESWRRRLLLLEGSIEPPEFTVHLQGPRHLIFMYVSVHKAFDWLPGHAFHSLGSGKVTDSQPQVPENTSCSDALAQSPPH